MFIKKVKRPFETIIKKGYKMINFFKKRIRNILPINTEIKNEIVSRKSNSINSHPFIQFFE